MLNFVWNKNFMLNKFSVYKVGNDRLFYAKGQKESRIRNLDLALIIKNVLLFKNNPIPQLKPMLVPFAPVFTTFDE